MVCISVLLQFQFEGDPSMHGEKRKAALLPGRPFAFFSSQQFRKQTYLPPDFVSQGGPLKRATTTVAVICFESSWAG
jgi:hypothetical protein